MAFCPADCDDNTLTPTSPLSCDLQPRMMGIDKIGFFLCDVDLPSPFTCGALEALVAANQLVFSSPLAEIEVADPTQEDIRLGNCLPAYKLTTERTITFQDRIKKDIPGSGSPVVGAEYFTENDFWADKAGKAARLRYMVVFCDGSVQVAKDANGNNMEGSLNVYRGFENVGGGATQKTISYIEGTLTFQGDPLDLNNKPELNADGTPFNINLCSAI